MASSFHMHNVQHLHMGHAADSARSASSALLAASQDQFLSLADSEGLSPIGERLLHDNFWTLLLGFVCFLVGILLIMSWCYCFAWSSDQAVFLRKWAHSQVQLGAQATPTRLLDVPNSGLAGILLNRFNIMLIFVPVGWASHLLHWSDTWSFMLNLIAMLPLANLMGVATEELAIHTGQTLGGLLNATFGNAVELIVVIQSLRKGLLIITKGTLLGSILANMLLVLGMTFLFGGLFGADDGKLQKNKEQSYTTKTAMVQAQLLLFCSFTIAMPSMFAQAHHVTPDHVVWISRAASFFILMTYGVFLIFQMYTHAQSFGGADELNEEESQISVGSALALLIGATCLVAVSSEFLVHAIESFTASTGFSEAFIGVILLPIVGNACEHSTAVVVALKDKMDLAIGIALGSTIQIALFVVPFAVLFGWAIDQPMTLNFEEINAWSLMLSSLLVVSVLVTGQSHWFNGFLLITAYATLAVLFFFAPDTQGAH